mgnify:CR=1 FL=1
MKKNYIIMALLMLVALFTVSCEDRLDIAKHGNMGSQDDFYKTDADAESAAASMYLNLRGLYYNWFFTKILLADDVWCGGGQRGDNNQMEQLNEYNFGSDHGMVQGLFSSLYGLIYKANLIIEKVQPDTHVKARTVAEAKCMRAWANFELVTLFGTAPLVDHLLQPDEYRQTNSTPEALWAAVETDLKDAISMNALESKTSLDDTDTGMHITQELAQALLGKTYVFEKKYEEAAQMLDKVITSGKYDLYEGEYDQQFHAVANNNRESMFECQMRNDPEKAWGQNSMLHIMQGWRYSNLTYTGTAAGEMATGTYGFMNPRKDLYEAFVQAEGVNGYRLRHTMLTYEQAKAYGVEIKPGVSLYGSEGYFMFKNRTLLADCVNDFPGFQVLQYIDQRIMRYAEVLLLAAEANLLSNHPDKALEYINRIRSRAQEPALGTVTLNDIKLEKRLELCLEGVRYQDLVRWGDAETVLANQGKQIPSFSEQGVSWDFTNTEYGFKAKNKLLPIPLKELELNPNISPNEGW